MEISWTDFKEKYGDLEVQFSHYYKYVFTYEGRTETGEFVSISLGGSADDIYRLDVVASDTLLVKEFEDPYHGTLYADESCENVIDSFFEGC